jgi:peroxiredoxin
MRKRFAALTALALLAAACGTRPDPDATDAASSTDDKESGQGRALEAGRALIGTAAPAALLKTIDGTTVDLGAAYGRKPVYLKFWATWCVPCREQMPAFEAEYQKYRDRILTVAVNTGFNDNEAAIREYRRRHGLSMPIAMDDGSLGAALNLRVTPQHVVIGRNGRILFVGHEENEELHQALEAALAQPGQAPGTGALVAGQSYGIGDLVKNPGAALTKTAGFPISGPTEGGKPRILMFFSPWCESYLKDSRPAQAGACARVRKEVNGLAQSGNYQLVGISSGLWSSNKDLDDYRATNALRIPLHLDADGQLFRSFGVQEVPTLVVIDATGRVARRVGPNEKDLNVAMRSARAD